MRTLRDINSHILDMSKSTWVDSAGKERTFDPATWKKDLEELVDQKATLKSRTYYDPNAQPREWLWWVRYDPPSCREFNIAKHSLPASPVIVDRDPYWPEGFNADTNGYFIYGDLVLMKRPYADHLKDEIQKVKMSKGSTKALQAEFEATAAAEGAGLKDSDKEGLERSFS